MLHVDDYVPSACRLSFLGVPELVLSLVILTMLLPRQPAFSGGVVCTRDMASTPKETSTP